MGNPMAQMTLEEFVGKYQPNASWAVPIFVASWFDFHWLLDRFKPASWIHHSSVSAAFTTPRRIKVDSIMVYFGLHVATKRDRPQT
jgi:hypothetical protein